LAHQEEQKDVKTGTSIATKEPTRLEVCSKFMSLMLFAKAGAVELGYKEKEKSGSAEVFKEIMIKMKN
jgi:hypothetical protein